MKRIGWARSHEGNVFVLNRECTSARWLTSSGSWRSGKYFRSCSEVSWPLKMITLVDRLQT
jgi:hypothetical protein